MPRLRRVVPHRSALFVTTSVEEGLMLTANPLIALTLTSCMARALRLWPVRICDFVVEATHIHFLLVVYNPEDLRGFMERFKTESAIALNRLMNRRSRTFWRKGYDSPVLLDVDKAVEKLCYLYTNPAKDNLVNSIDEYPGLTSWQHFVSASSPSCSEYALIATKLLARRDFTPLPQRKLTSTDYEELAQSLGEGKPDLSFPLYHSGAWLSCFGITDPEEQEAYRTRIIETVRSMEKAFHQERTEKGHPVIGASALTATRPGTAYAPQRKGRRTLCLSFNLSLRSAFIIQVKALVAKGKEVLSLWKKGATACPYPSGLYPPCIPKLLYPLQWHGVCDSLWNISS
jgi:REP element-mobilizing transposase RayT